MAAAEDMKVFKKTKSEHTLNDSAWITGVDYDDDDEDNNYESDNNHDNDEKHDQENMAESLYENQDDQGPIQAEANNERPDADGEDAYAEIDK